MSQLENPEKAAVKAAGPESKKPTPEITVKVSWCKGCGLCVDYCNRGVLKMEGVLPVIVSAEKCNQCLQCEVICPDFAIEVHDGKISAAEAKEKS